MKIVSPQRRYWEAAENPPHHIRIPSCMKIIHAEFVRGAHTSLLRTVLSVILLPPAIIVLMPVKVARGMFSSRISSSSVLAARFRNAIRLFLGYQASFGDLCCRDLCAIKIVRKALRHTIVTAIHASTICQKFSQVTSTASVEVRIRDIPIKATTIIMVDRQKKMPKTSFCPIFIRICQRIRMGMTMTSD